MDLNLSDVSSSSNVLTFHMIIPSYSFVYHKGIFIDITVPDGDDVLSEMIILTFSHLSPLGQSPPALQTVQWLHPYLLPLIKLTANQISTLIQHVGN